MFLLIYYLLFFPTTKLLALVYLITLIISITYSQQHIFTVSDFVPSDYEKTYSIIIPQWSSVYLYINDTDGTLGLRYSYGYEPTNTTFDGQIFIKNSEFSMGFCTNYFNYQDQELWLQIFKPTVYQNLNSSFLHTSHEQNSIKTTDSSPFTMTVWYQEGDLLSLVNSTFWIDLSYRYYFLDLQTEDHVLIKVIPISDPQYSWSIGSVPTIYVQETSCPTSKFYSQMSEFEIDIDPQNYFYLKNKMEMDHKQKSMDERKYSPSRKFIIAITSNLPQSYIIQLCFVHSSSTCLETCPGDCSYTGICNLTSSTCICPQDTIQPDCHKKHKDEFKYVVYGGGAAIFFLCIVAIYLCRQCLLLTYRENQLFQTPSASDRPPDSTLNPSSPLHPPFLYASPPPAPPNTRSSFSLFSFFSLTPSQSPTLSSHTPSSSTFLSNTVLHSFSTPFTINSSLPRPPSYTSFTSAPSIFTHFSPFTHFLGSPVQEPPPPYTPPREIEEKDRLLSESA